MQLKKPVGKLHNSHVPQPGGTKMGRAKVRLETGDDQGGQEDISQPRHVSSEATVRQTDLVGDKDAVPEVQEVLHDDPVLQV